MPNSSSGRRSSTRKSRVSEQLPDSQESNASLESDRQSSSHSQANESDTPSIRRSSRPQKRNTLLLDAFEEAQTSGTRQKRVRKESGTENTSQDSKSIEISPFKSPTKPLRTLSKRSKPSEANSQSTNSQSQDSVLEHPAEINVSSQGDDDGPPELEQKVPLIRVEPSEDEVSSQEDHASNLLQQLTSIRSQEDHENSQSQALAVEYVKDVPHVEEEVVTVSVDDMEYVDEHGNAVHVKDGLIVHEKDQEAYEYEILDQEVEHPVHPQAHVSRNHQESMSTMLESLFYSKLNIYERTFTTSHADVAINMCTPDITDGYMFFDEIHALAGPRLIRDCKNYIGMQNGSCRVTRSYNASNYKCIIHTALPHLPGTTRIVDVEVAQLSIKRCLNEAVARGAQTIAFPSFFPCFSPLVSAEFLLKVISNWMYLTDQKGQLAKLREIQILCHSPMIYRIFKGMINKLYADLMEIAAKHGVENTTLFDVYGVVFKRNKNYHSPTRYDSYPRAHPITNEMDSYYSNQYEEEFLPERQRRRRRARGEEMEVPPPEQQVRLELSAKLQPSVLVLDDKDGLKRQYRLTNKSKDGRKLYFRCSFCDTLIRKTNIRIRAKITLQDGRIMGDQFPKHHPDCKPKSPEELAVQQIDRKSRREVKEGILQPREAYEKARQRAMQYHHEIRAQSMSLQDSSMEMEHGEGLDQIRPKTEHVEYHELPNFPEWQRIRQQYFRMRKVGEIQKHNQMQVRTDALRQATFIENDDDETMLVEVDDPDAVQGEDLVDVEMPEPRRAPRILAHHRAPSPQA